MFIVIMLINLVIAYFNARVCGYQWESSKRAGGWGRLVVWSGAVQSGIGFTLAYYALTLFLWSHYGHLSPRIAHYVNDFFIIGVTIPAIGTGFILMVESWRAFYQDRNFLSGGVAIWNTGAQISNTYTLLRVFGDAVGDLASSKDSQDGSSNYGLMILVALSVSVVAVALGALTTAYLIRYYAREVDRL